MKAIDLFSGTGAFTLLSMENSITTVFANDLEPASEAIYNVNFSHLEGHLLTLGDLNEIDTNDIPEHDILFGGFPCQPFSIAGKQKGFQDARSNVFWKILNILKVHKPRVFMLENVKNLVSHDSGNTLETILEELGKVGYHVKHAVLDTCKITRVPQHRERIYLVGFRDEKEYDDFKFTFSQRANLPIQTFLEEEVDDKYYYTDKLKCYDVIKTGVVKKGTIYQFRRHYVRENKSGVCPTLTANMGSGGHNVPLILDDKGIRKLTPRECFNLQGFPKDYKLPPLSDSKLYKLAGNAISLPVARRILKRVLRVF